MQSDRRVPLFPRIFAVALRFPRLCAIAAGALASCGFQPLSLWPLTFLAVAWLLELVVRSRTARGALFTGWCFGLGHFTLGNNWIATAFTYQANMPVWLGGIAVVLLAIYLAVFPALAAWAASLATRQARSIASNRAFVITTLMLAAAWIVTEWLRGWAFTGFAWNPLGVSLLGSYDARGLAMTAPWLGTYGLSGLVVLISALPGLCIRAALGTSGRRRWLPVTTGIAVFAALAALMLLPDPWAHEKEGSIRFTLIQPDLRQEIIDDPRHYEANFVKMARLSLPDDPGEKRVVFWPESGLGDYLRDGYPGYLYRMYTYAGDPVIARERIGRVIGPYGMLLTGAVDMVMEGDDGVAARNSVTMINGGGDIVGGYSKAHLVPFGEYLPLRWLLEPLGASRLVAGVLDFWPGPGPRSYDLGSWGEVGVQICYEIVFSGKVVDPHNRPDYIYNPSNDGWFGSWGPPQHLAQARLRAIEEGLPVLRSTTTGISAVIDADGIVRAHVARHAAGRIDGRIPPPHEPTLFARMGNALPLAFAALLFLVAFSMVALDRRQR
jgi:apolipoprotein N-acyltransferase